MFDHDYVEGVFHEGTFFGHGFLLVVRHDGGGVDGVGTFPEGASGFAKFPLEEAYGYFTEGVYGADAHEIELLMCLIAYAGDLAHRQGGYKSFFGAIGYVAGTVGFGFAGTYLGDGLVDRQAEGYGEAGLTDDLIAEA